MSPSNSSSTPFAESMRGQQPQPEDRQFPAVLQDLYATASQRREGSAEIFAPLPNGWTRMDDSTLQRAGIDPGLLHDAKSGFDAAFYRNEQGQVVLGFCGTDEGKDWKHNLGQGLGFDDAQYASAIQLGSQAKQAFGDQVVISGHSLGGGLAAASAMVNDIPAVTYNAAGVNDRTLERQGLDASAAKDYASSELIRGYHVKNEILTHLQEDSIPLKWAMPNAAGHQIELPEPDPLSFGQRLVPGRMLMHRMDLHGMDSVMKAQEMQSPGQAQGAGSQLFNDAVVRLDGQRERLGLRDDTAFLNTAASVAARASSDGLQRIDHLVPNRDGDSLIAVQGRMDDPAHLRSHVQTASAANEPAHGNVDQLQQHNQQQSQQSTQQEAQRRGLQQ
ncbi:XVIPCD domain-containing protein [Xanthomonas arboricola]|uniref:XVIPCD domain-containing protein n=2 Tax=Xanthomonas arboricola TaxID=56448 RepID=UPI00069DF3AD|nr:XVIPCD domain-containing protein [Xanthomonas arboricola]KOB00257.1 phospholipase [Xanthomonas arboricola]KOB07301.1 phospholipase [Xanthomonas arboricola]KOB07839.1 phospholipase [Xanthomonas arboricola]KOB18961.1 phospholipase [Xanthomonas arboricola]KOB23993.1 phospholipase [Xanthomonas arboricola]